MLESHILSIVTLGPALAAILLGLIPGRHGQLVRWLALGVSLVVFFASLLIWFGFDPDLPGMQMVEQVDWIPQFGIQYHLGVDGISLLLVMLTTLLVPVVIGASWRSVTDRVKGFHICLLLLATGMVGAFLALDVFLFYVFWELMLIPMYFIIGVWGGPRRIYAAVKFFLFTMAGSVLMLVAILYTARAPFRGRGSVVLQLYGVARYRPRAGDRRVLEPADAGFLSVCPGFCDQGPDVPVPHMAA